MQHWAICWTVLSSQQPCFLSFSCCLVIAMVHNCNDSTLYVNIPKTRSWQTSRWASIRKTCWQHLILWFLINHLYVISAKHNCTPPKNTGLVNPAVVLHDISLQSISLGHVCSTYLTSKLAAIHSKRVNCHPDYSTHKSSACTPVFLLIPYNW